MVCGANSGSRAKVKAIYNWATTPPQAYAVYAVLVIAIGALSFYAGSLKQKPAIGMAPATVHQPNK